MRAALLTMLLLLFAITVYAEVPEKPAVNEHVFDYAHVLDNEAEEEMRALIRQVEEQTSNQIVLMTIETIGEMEAFEFGTEVIRQWGSGRLV